MGTFVMIVGLLLIQCGLTVGLMLLGSWAADRRNRQDRMLKALERIAEAGHEDNS